MAIDMIEQSELSALAPSRLGNKCFINDDDDNYANGNGKIFGIKVRGKKWDDKQRAKEVTSGGEWNIDPARAGDCNYLQDRLTQLQNTIEGRTSQASKKYRTEAETRVLKGYETDYKNRVASLKCVEKQLAKQKEEEVKANLKLAQETANIPLPQLMGEEPTQKSNLTKYLLFGVGGLVLVITTVVLLRRN
jgi:hypothetical protein